MKKVKLMFLQSGSEDWLGAAQKVYEKKLNHFANFELVAIKTKSIARDQKNIKIAKEKDLILSKLTDKDYLIAMYEKGKAFKSSVQFADYFKQKVEMPGKDIVFLIGGSYGLHDDVLKRADQVMTLSNLTMSHHIAQSVLLEQIYRAFTIIKNLPYHNE